MRNAFITQLLRNTPHMRLRQQIQQRLSRSQTKRNAHLELDDVLTCRQQAIQRWFLIVSERLAWPKCAWLVLVHVGTLRAANDGARRDALHETIDVNVPPPRTFLTTYLTVLFAQQRSKVGCAGERVLRVGRALMHRAHKSVATGSVLRLWRLSSTMVVFFFNQHTNICACL